MEEAVEIQRRADEQATIGTTIMTIKDANKKKKEREIKEKLDNREVKTKVSDEKRLAEIAHRQEKGKQHRLGKNAKLE
jgi:hypothetical protein